MRSILFVCTANRFRSPLAEVFLRNLIEVNGLQEEWNVSSAGTWTTNGLPAVKEAILEARNRGLDLLKHKSKIINEEMVNQFDFILVMEKSHKEALIAEFPAHKNKIILIYEILEDYPFDIPDPFIAEESTQIIALEIENIIKEIFPIIMNDKKFYLIPS